MRQDVPVIDPNQYLIVFCGRRPLRKSHEKGPKGSNSPLYLTRIKFAFLCNWFQRAAAAIGLYTLLVLGQWMGYKHVDWREGDQGDACCTCPQSFEPSLGFIRFGNRFQCRSRISKNCFPPKLLMLQIHPPQEALEEGPVLCMVETNTLC